MINTVDSLLICEYCQLCQFLVAFLVDFFLFLSKRREESKRAWRAAAAAEKGSDNIAMILSFGGETEKSFPNHMTYMVVLIFVSLALAVSRTPVYTAMP